MESRASIQLAKRVVEGKCGGRAPFPSTTAFSGGPPPHLPMGRNRMVHLPQHPLQPPHPRPPTPPHHQLRQPPEQRHGPRRPPPPPRRPPRRDRICEARGPCTAQTY